MSTPTALRSHDAPSPPRNAVDLSVLHSSADSPSFATVRRSAGPDADVVDSRIPCDPNFPTPEVFDPLGADLPSLLKQDPPVHLAPCPDVDVRVPRRCLVLIAGLPGAGKTTLVGRGCRR